MPRAATPSKRSRSKTPTKKKAPAKKTSKRGRSTSSTRSSSKKRTPSRSPARRASSPAKSPKTTTTTAAAAAASKRAQSPTKSPRKSATPTPKPSTPTRRAAQARGALKTPAPANNNNIICRTFSSITGFFSETDRVYDRNTTRMLNDLAGLIVIVVGTIYFTTCAYLLYRETFGGGSSGSSVIGAYVDSLRELVVSYWQAVMGGNNNIKDSVIPDGVPKAPKMPKMKH